MPWLRIHPKWNQLNHSLTYSPVTTLSTTDGWASMIISTYSDVSMVWMRRTHDSFTIFGCEDGLDEEDPWLFQQIWMWGRSGWRPMILSTYSDVRTVWMTTHDSFDIFGCEDGLDDNPSFFSTYSDVRTVWMKTHDSFQHIRMWGWSGWGGPMITSTNLDVRTVWMTTHDSFNVFGCEDGLLALPITRSKCYGQGKDCITKYHLSKILME